MCVLLRRVRRAVTNCRGRRKLVVLVKRSPLLDVMSTGLCLFSDWNETLDSYWERTLGLRSSSMSILL
jgi:hypothetical protein